MMSCQKLSKMEKLNMSEGELAKMISVNIPADTRLISISVNARTGQDAQTLCLTRFVKLLQKKSRT